MATGDRRWTKYGRGDGGATAATSRWEKYGRTNGPPDRWTKYGVKREAERPTYRHTGPEELSPRRSSLLRGSVEESFPEPGELSPRQTRLRERSTEPTVPPPSLPEGAGEFVKQAGAGAAERALSWADRLATGAAHVGSYPSPDVSQHAPSRELDAEDFPEPSEFVAPRVQRTKEEVEEFYGPPESGAGVAGRVTGSLGTEGLTYILGGSAIRRGLGFGARTGGPVVEAIKDAAAMLPLDIAITSGGPEESVAGALAPVVEKFGHRRTAEALQRVAEDPKARAAFEVATGMGADLALRAVAGGVKGAARLAGRPVRRGLEGIGRQMTGDAEPRVPEPGPRTAAEAAEMAEARGIRTETEADRLARIQQEIDAGRAQVRRTEELTGRSILEPEPPSRPEPRTRPEPEPAAPPPEPGPHGPEAPESEPTTRPAFREEEVERTPDLFGEERVEGPEQTGFTLEEPRTMERTTDDARSTVSALQGKVRRGEASPEEVDRYTEALRFLRREEGLDAEEIGLRTREPATPRDERVGDLFDEPVAERPPYDPRSPIQKRAWEDYRGLDEDELINRWQKLVRGLARRETAAEALEGKSVKVVENTWGEPVAVGTGVGRNARGGLTQSEERIQVVERLLERKGVDVDELDRLDPFQQVGRSDVMGEYDVGGQLGSMNNKDLVGVGGQRIRNMSDEELTEEIERILPVLQTATGRENVGLMERMAILSAEANRPARNIPDSVFGGADPRLLAGIARAGGGAFAGSVTGGLADQENRLRGSLTGAAAGAAVGLGAGRLAGRLTRGRPSYLDSDAVQRVLSTVGRSGDEAGGGPGILGRLTSKAGETAEKLYTRVIDEAHPLKEFGREVEGSERLADEATRAKGYRGAVMERLEDNFQSVVDLARGHEEGVVALAKAERALELLDAGLEKTDIDRETLERTVEELSQVPEVRRAVDALRAYYRSLLDRKLANGVISQEQYDAIIESGRKYIPFVREVDEGLSSGTVQFTPDGRLKSGATGVRRMGEGKATAATVDPFEQAIRDTFETERRVAKQRVTNLTAEIVDNNPEAAAELGLRFVPKADAGRRGARVTPVNVKGERRWLEVADDEIWNAFASFDPYSANIFVRILSKPKRWLREGVTALPDFGIANAIRDNVMTALQYPFPTGRAALGAGIGATGGAATAEEGERLEGAIQGGLAGLGVGAITPHLARTLSAMRDIVGPKLGGDAELYQEWLREGGSGFGFYARNKKGARKLLEQMRKEGVSPSDIVSPKSWWQVLQGLNRVIEEAPRVARYKYLREQGEDVAAGIAGSRDVSLDFSRMGSHMKGLSATTAFFNAQVQGWDKLARLLKKPRTWATGAGLVTAPSVGLWLINKDNEEYWDRPQWERNLFWLVPKDGGGFWRIPKPFEVGFLFGSIPERILDYAYQKDPEALRFALTDMLSTYGPGASLPIPTAAEPVIENIADYSFFRNRPIDPHQYENLPPELQYDQRTSTLAIGAGRALGVSPSKVENLIRGYGGSAVGEFLEGSTRLAKELGIDERPEQPEPDIPLAGRFMTRETSISEREMSLRRKFDRAEEARNAVRQFIQNKEPAKARRYARENRDLLAQYGRLKKANDILRTARQARQQIVRSEDLAPEEKRRAIRRINRRTVGIAEAITRRTEEGNRARRGESPRLRPEPSTTGQTPSPASGSSRWEKYGDAAAAVPR